METIALEELNDEGIWEKKTLELDLGQDFPIDENNVDGELCRAGALLAYYGNLAADLHAQYIRKKSNLEDYAATVAVEIRGESRTSATKITESGIQEKIITNDGYRQMNKQLIEADRYYRKAENLWKSQQKRTDCLTALAYKQRAEYVRA